MQISPKYIRIASFDIGKVNFAHYIEECDIQVLKDLDQKYHNLPTNLRRKVKGDMNPQIENILNQMYTSGKRIGIRVVDLRDDKESKKYDMTTRENVLLYLDQLRKYLDTCDIFVVEQQFFKTFGGKGKQKGSAANVDAIKIAETVVTWMKITYPEKEVIYFSSTYKTQILGAPWGMSKPQRKKWSVEKAREILEMRKDEEAMEVYELMDSMFRKRLNEDKVLNCLENLKTQDEDLRYLAEKYLRERQKLDDVSDCVIQLQAYKFRNLIGRF